MNRWDRRPVVDWTDDCVGVLRNLWAEGQSASQIAVIIGGGATRNAVMGKLYRLGMLGHKRRDKASWNGRDLHGRFPPTPPRSFSWEQHA